MKHYTSGKRLVDKAFGVGSICAMRKLSQSCMAR